MKSLPASVAFYKSTPEFTETSVPAGLRRDHTTAAGVRAGIVVLEGELDYCAGEPKRRSVGPEIFLDAGVRPG